MPTDSSLARSDAVMMASAGYVCNLEDRARALWCSVCDLRIADQPRKLAVASSRVRPEKEGPIADRDMKNIAA